MKKLMLNLFVIGLFFAPIGLGSAVDNSSDIMTVEVNIFESSVGISVPDKVVFGDITKGYLSERQEVKLTNTGTTNIVVAPELVNDSEEIFRYLSFKRVLDAPLTKIGFFEIEIEKPSVVGETRDQNVYMYLDLTDYLGEIEEDVIGHESEVIFWAMKK